MRTRHIITGLSGLSPFDEFMRIQVSNMETLFKMDFYFPGLRFPVVVDRCFWFIWMSFKPTFFLLCVNLKIESILIWNPEFLIRYDLTVFKYLFL